MADLKKPCPAMAATPPVHWLPKLQREERIEMLDNFQGSARWNIDFIIMMGLSTALASVGLLNNSVSAVIGAMLVAPLMSPLLGGGFALIQGNLILFRDCLKAMLYGVAVGLVVSMAIGVITPAYEPTLEIEARGKVNLLDLGIALFSGMAAAYALSRPSLAATLSGVAIAAALVPPLAVVGLALTSSEYLLAGLSAILLLTNLVAIVLGAAIVFWLIGAQGTSTDAKTPLWSRRVVMLLVLSTVILAAPLGDRLQSQLHAGQTRPLNYPLPPLVRRAIHDRIAQEFGVEIITMGRLATDEGEGASIILYADSVLSPSLIPDLKAAARKYMGENTPVKIVPLQVASGQVTVPEGAK